jgi:septal ring factor EnvC (AmiA/AmiB activator)
MPLSCFDEAPATCQSAHFPGDRLDKGSVEQEREVGLKLKQQDTLLGKLEDEMDSLEEEVKCIHSDIKDVDSTEERRLSELALNRSLLTKLLDDQDVFPTHPEGYDPALEHSLKVREPL